MIVKNKNVILKDQNGIAFMMILTAIAILTSLIFEFNFDSKINQIKGQNLQDISQAKLCAESGLLISMTRLQLYKEAFNTIQKNKNLKQMVRAEMLNQIWNVPFVYPIPELPGMNAIQRSALERFKENSLLEGTLSINIENISNKININALRISHFLKNVEEDNQDSQTNDELFAVDQQLLVLLEQGMLRKQESDIDFFNRYSSVDFRQIIGNLKFYVSDYNSYSDATFTASEAAFSDLGVTAKHAPLSSIEEIYLIPGWNDELVDMIKEEITVHNIISIDLNKITENMLRLLFPNLMPDDIQKFFQWKNDPLQKKFFQNIKDFQIFFTDVERIMSEKNFEERIEQFTKAGVKFGPSPSLFKITSEGGYQNAKYTLTAYVSIPLQPNLSNKKQKQKTEENPDIDFDQEQEQQTDGGSAKGAQSEQSTQLLEPRIVELRID